MALGLIGRKLGMTRVYTEEGAAIPVTVVEVEPNRVMRVKTPESDGYRAVQVTTGGKHRNRISKPEGGEFAKISVEVGRGLWEFRLTDSEGDELQAGGEVRVDLFEQGAFVDVTGVTIGKGFAGTIKRHNFSMGDATHGNSLSHRAPGSIGQRQTPGRVIKGKRMSGHMGDKQRTIQRLQVVRVDNERNLLLIKGALPGARGGDVLIKPSVKAKN
jgi:large subunit ribosomal protein L3